MFAVIYHIQPYITVQIFFYGNMFVIIVTIPGIFVVYTQELQDFNVQYLFILYFFWRS